MCQNRILDFLFKRGPSTFSTKLAETNFCGPEHQKEYVLTRNLVSKANRSPKNARKNADQLT